MRYLLIIALFLPLGAGAFELNTFDLDRTYKEAKQAEANRDYHYEQARKHQQRGDHFKEKAVKLWGKYIEIKKVVFGTAQVKQQQKVASVTTDNGLGFIDDFVAENVHNSAGENPPQQAEIRNDINTQQGYDLNKLAYAIAMAETHNCEKGYGATHNNCFGIKHGNTAPCPGVPKMAMCRYDTPEESYEAFKKIWSKRYKAYPNWKLANKRTGGDRTQSRLEHVGYYYNQ